MYVALPVLTIDEQPQDTNSMFKVIHIIHHVKMLNYGNFLLAL